MKKFLSSAIILLGIFLATTIFAATLNMHEKPDTKSKVVASVEKGKQLMSIYQTETEMDWVKVANPQNGDVGWVQAKELTGPITTIKVDGSKIQQIVTSSDNKGKGPTVYSIIQYSDPNEMKPEDAEKAIKEMEKRHEKMRESMQKMQDKMQKSMQEMFKDFDNFYLFTVKNK